MTLFLLSFTAGIAGFLGGSLTGLWAFRQGYLAGLREGAVRERVRRQGKIHATEDSGDDWRLKPD